jgi:hypothetical protein
MTKIKNISSIPDNICSCGSNLEHWQNFSGEPVVYCSEYNCLRSGKDLIGAHVQKTTEENNYYIIPLCKMHSRAKRELDVTEHTIFVSANIKETCG